MIVGPPGLPTTARTCPSSSTIVGHMLDSGRLPGLGRFCSPWISPNSFGRPARAVKSFISLLSSTPLSPATKHEPSEVLTV